VSRLFGTDGVRGTAGRYPLDDETVARLGAALVQVLAADARPIRLVVGRDTRESGPAIEAALARGARAAGAAVTTVGVMPTPAVAFLTAAHRFDAGVVVSASHNPFADNGVKIFSSRGEKLADALEEAIEARVADRAWHVPEAPAGGLDAADWSDQYLDFLVGTVSDPKRLAGARVLADTAHGATYRLAPRLFERLGLCATILNAEPDGRNINRDCGSTRPEGLAAAMAAGGYDLGVAFDGDGDRAIFVDRAGRVVDGDAVLLVCARHLQRAGRLPGALVVATVMSNLGLERALAETGIRLARCPVGDKYVREEMLAQRAALGGEQSGHIIFGEHHTTGDGLLTTLQVLDVMAATGRSLGELAAALVVCPQVLVNGGVREKQPIAEVPEVRAAIAEAEARLDGRGRVLVRYSGTEPLLRIMVEGDDAATIRACADGIADTVRRVLG
jgi:phosphoglucosamine mutase